LLNKEFGQQILKFPRFQYLRSKKILSVIWLKVAKVEIFERIDEVSSHNKKRSRPYKVRDRFLIF